MPPSEVSRRSFLNASAMTLATAASALTHPAEAAAQMAGVKRDTAEGGIGVSWTFRCGTGPRRTGAAGSGAKVAAWKLDCQTAWGCGGYTFGMLRRIRYYPVGDAEGRLTASQLRHASRDVQIEVMKSWFDENYTDPVDCLPYESAEGGYQFIYGGPYDPSEELRGEFGGVVRDSVIDELASDLSRVSFEWSGNPNLYPPDDYVYESVSPFSSAYEPLGAALETFRDIADVKLPSELHAVLMRMLFAGTIATMEAYLSDYFIAMIKSDAELMKRFVSTTPEFKQTKFSLSEIHSELACLDKTIANHLGQVVWHNLSRVRLMYKDALGIEFPSDLSALYRAVEVRHDIVHRNGRPPEGRIGHVVNKAEVVELFELVRSLAHHIEIAGLPDLAVGLDDSRFDLP